MFEILEHECPRGLRDIEWKLEELIKSDSLAHQAYRIAFWASPSQDPFVVQLTYHAILAYYALLMLRQTQKLLIEQKIMDPNQPLIMKEMP